MKTISIAVLALLCGVNAVQYTVHQLAQLQTQKESDELANGDKNDDKELEDEVDPEDGVVDDYGFGRNWVQLRSQHQKKNQQKVQRESDDLCDGDSADDKQLEDETSNNDMIVDDHGFGNNWRFDAAPAATADLQLAALHKLRRHNRRPADNQQLLYSVNKYSEEIANGDSADDKDLHEEEDANDAVVDINGSGSSRYGSAVPTEYFAGNHIFADHFGTVPREDVQLSEQNLLQQKYNVERYSDGIANGDSADDKDLHEEEDTNDDVVDINGSGKDRYGSAMPVDYFAGNHIFADHFGTVPRDD